MARQDNLGTVKALFKFFGAGDATGVAESCQPDAEWRIGVGGEEGIVPYAGVHRGRNGILAFLGRLQECTETKLFEPQEFIAEGDKVVVTGRSELVARPTGRAYGGAWVQVITLDDGRVACLDMYADSARAVSAWQKG